MDSRREIDAQSVKKNPVVFCSRASVSHGRGDDLHISGPWFILFYILDRKVYEVMGRNLRSFDTEKNF